MSFRPVFIAVVIAFALVVGAFLVNRARPRVETELPSAASVRATGKCAECHAAQQYSVVHEYEMSRHAQRGVSCLDCRQPATSQHGQEHHGFTIVTRLTAGNCRSCHESIYQEFLRSRHAAVSWAAVFGEQALTPDQVAFAERYQPGYVKRAPHPLVAREGASASSSGCANCHSVGKPNDDGTIGTCTSCHTRHTSSVAIARLPTTCGQCHMGPDHSQLEIYEESKHGVMFQAQERLLNLDAPPKALTTRDMFVPTCATCHMSGLNGQKVTHDPSDRLSYYLADAITKPRPNKERAQAEMQLICTQCHASSLIARVYADAEKVVANTNTQVQQASDLMTALRKDGVLTGPPFSTPIDFLYFDLWHYDGRTSKHGAFMGGADFVQWHGNYPMLARTVQLQAQADELRRRRGR
ncbi:MAG TPA: multiheme c-type cytochrome [Vicinamibacterales bacterium]|nr:multiheme c-type cytochrome [Vicinamibacterales bacterium]